MSTPTVKPNGSSPFDPSAITFSRIGRSRYLQRLSDVGRNDTSLAQPWDYSAFSDVLWTRSSFGTSLASTWTPGIYLATFGSGTSSGYRHVFDHSTVAPFACVQVTCNWTGSAGTTNAIDCGLYQAGGTHYLVARFDALAGTHGKIQLVYNNGSGETVLQSYSLTSAPAQASVLDFSLHGCAVSIYFGGVFIMSIDTHGSIEFRDKTVMATYLFGFAMQGDGIANTLSLTGSIAKGYFGGIGATDFRLIRDKYGNVYQDANGLIYFTADLTGWGFEASNSYGDAANFNTGHSAIFSLDPRSGLPPKEVGKIFPWANNNVFTYLSQPYTNTPPGGNNSVGNCTDVGVIWDNENQQFVVTCLLLQPYYFTYYGYIQQSQMLSGICVPQVGPLALNPDYNNSQSLNCAVWYDATGNWNVGYSEAGIGYPTLRRGPTLESLSFAAIDNAPSGGYTEGATIQRIAGKVYLLFTNYAVYDPTGGALAKLGTLNVTNPVTNLGVNTWNTLFEYQNDGITEFYALFFDSSSNAQTYLVQGDSTVASGNIVPFTNGTFCLYKGDTAHTLNYYQAPLTQAFSLASGGSSGSSTDSGGYRLGSPVVTDASGSRLA